MVNYEKKYFGGNDGGLDADSAPFAVDPNNWVNSENIRTLSTDAGVTKSVEAVGSTILRSVIQPSVNFITIGFSEDTANNRILRFKYCIYGPYHQITSFDISTQTEYTVLRNEQTEGMTGLLLSKNYPIHSARVEAGLLIWTDNYQEPKKINIDAGIKLNHPSYVTDQEAYASPIDYTTLTLIKKAPQLPLSIEKKQDVSYVNNFIANEAMMFYYRYYFRDGEESVLSTNGQLATYNFEAEVFNYVQITIPNDEIIEQDVQRIEIIVQYGNGGNMFVIKFWDKDIPADAQAIQDHNDGTQQLTYDFYNDITGTAVSNADATKPFDRVPLLSKALEIARNRAFLANNLSGYDTPTTSSLTASVVEVTEGADLIGNWFRMHIEVFGDGKFDPPTDIYDAWVMRVDGANPLFYNYDSVVYPTVPPTTINLVDATYSSNTLADLANQIIGDSTVFNTILTYPNAYSSTIGDGSGSVSNGARFFKSNGSYGVAIVFYDRYRRKCGVVNVNDVRVNMPLRTYNQTVYNQGILWALSNTNALNEIPDWAYFYQIVRTQNLTTRFFVQARANDITYAQKDGDGNITYTDTYSPSLYSLAIDISALASFGMGYTFTEGDLLIFYQSPGTAGRIFRILGVQGKYVLCTLFNLGNPSTVNALFEIYTPYKQQADEFFYEVGECYQVSNPQTDNRSYSVTTGVLNGDISILTRTDASSASYFTEAMSPNDKFWQNWYSDIGWANIVLRIGQVRLKNSIFYSQTFIEGTRVNGLNSFDAAAQEDIPLECGQIQKLILTSKVNNELGGVMLAICESETASLYLGEVQQYGSTGPATIVQAPNVIGTINVLKGNFGTSNPESVTEFRGNVFWYDAFNGKIIQYSNAGLFPISNYKMTRFWKLFSDQYNSMTMEEIEALGSRPFVYTAVDPHHWELLVTIPKLLTEPPKGYLPDYPSTIYPFDIWDGQAKTLVFKLNAEPNRWNGAYKFTPESMIAVQNKLFSSKYGQLYEHNDTESFCNFYGVQYKVNLMFVANQDKTIPKVYNNISVNGSCPSFVYMRSENPYVQATDLIGDSFRDYEGNNYATILRNKIVPTSTGFTTDGLLTAERMRTDNLFVWMQWEPTTENINFNFLSIGYQLSAGHKTFKK